MRGEMARHPIRVIGVMGLPPIRIMVIEPSMKETIMIGVILQTLPPNIEVDSRTHMAIRGSMDTSTVLHTISTGVMDINIVHPIEETVYRTGVPHLISLPLGDIPLIQEKIHEGVELIILLNRKELDMKSLNRINIEYP